MCPILFFWHRGQFYCRDEVSCGVASTSQIVDIVYGRTLIGGVSLVRKVSLCYRGCQRLRHDQVCVFLLKVLSEGWKEGFVAGDLLVDASAHGFEPPHR